MFHGGTQAAIFMNGREWTELDSQAWSKFNRAIIELNSGSLRSEVAILFKRVNTEHPGSYFEAQAKDYSEVLTEMSREEKLFATNKPVSTLPQKEQITYWFFRLRDCNAVQSMQPGHTTLPSAHWAEFLKGRWQQPDPADRLVEFGFYAVPILVAALDDHRLTRAYGYRRNFEPQRYVLRFGDAAIQILEVIAGESFYRPTSTSSYLLKESPELQQEVKARVTAWWKTAQEQGEVECLAVKIAALSEAWKTYYQTRSFSSGPQPQVYLDRLARVGGSRALPVIQGWVKTFPQNGRQAPYYRQMLLTGVAEAEKEVRAAAEPTSEAFDFNAATALLEGGRVDKSAYCDLLFNGARNICRRARGETISVNEPLLFDSGDERCIFLLAGIWRANMQIRCKCEPTDNRELNLKIARQLAVRPAGFTPSQGFCWPIHEFLGKPLGELTQDDFVRSANRERLGAYLDSNGIKPALSFPWED